MKIIILSPYPPFVSPSQRFRFEHYLPDSASRGISYSYHSFLDIKTWELIFTRGNNLNKGLRVGWGFVKRFFLLFKISSYDFVYIHREAAPIGPPFFEFVIAKILRKKIIYDFDDAIWVKISSSANPGTSFIKCSWKVKYICKWSYITSVGNDYLADFAGRYCKKVVIIPTVVNTEELHNKIKNQLDEPLTIGWTGTFTNFYNLQKIINPVKKLQEKYNCRFLIIADADPEFSNMQYEFIKWNKVTEIDDLIKLNIGIMPLKNTEVELGKCGFKAIQYLSLGIPAVVSPVGANCKVVKDGVVGLWAEGEEDWYKKLESLINDTERRISMGIAARKHIIETYSVAATRNLFFDLFTK
jgi:glycosyltransferase involved in cell wall biosynthesis